jgi:3-deoxy-7-phosphoheptulonate synthase
MGANRIKELFPKLLKRVKDEGKNVVWSCDPMHANIEKTSNGFKTRNFDNILLEVKQFFEIHKEMGTIPAGIHLEMTGNNVTECTGSLSCSISENDLGSRYHTQCDPRLNANQALELAFMLGETIND